MKRDKSQPGGPDRDSRKQLILFGLVVVVLVVAGVLIGALAGSEPAVPEQSESQTRAIQEQARHVGTLLLNSRSLLSRPADV